MEVETGGEGPQVLYRQLEGTLVPMGPRAVFREAWATLGIVTRTTILHTR